MSQACAGGYVVSEPSSPVGVIRNTDLCVLIIPQEQAWLRVLVCPGRFVPSTIPREQGMIVTMPKFVCLRDFSKNPHGSTQYPLVRATVLAVSPS